MNRNTQVDMNEMVRGQVWGYWYDEAGRQTGHFQHRNTLTYRACDVMAALMAGQVAYAPTHIGYLYGTSSTYSELKIGQREQSWSDLSAEAALAGANLQISAFIRPPQLTLNGDSDLYSANSTIFTATTGSDIYGFSGAQYAGPLVSTNYIYHAVLLTRLSTGAYLPVARLTLKENGQYPQKPDGWELALFWQITFS
jgi:hypothetical protein